MVSPLSSECALDVEVEYGSEQIRIFGNPDNYLHGVAIAQPPDVIRRLPIEQRRHSGSSRDLVEQAMPVGRLTSPPPNSFDGKRRGVVAVAYVDDGAVTASVVQFRTGLSLMLFG